jgi:branched-subunit amino acid transport protein
MSAAYIWGVIGAMALANFAVRFPPLAVLSQLALPEWLRRWLSFIPVSVMATLVVGEVARPDGRWIAPLVNPYLWAAAATGLVYWKSRSFLGATVLGIVAFLVFRALLG